MSNTELLTEEIHKQCLAKLKIEFDACLFSLMYSEEDIHLLAEKIHRLRELVGILREEGNGCITTWR